LFALVFIGTLLFFAFLGSVSSGLFLSFLMAALTFSLTLWKQNRPKGKHLNWRDMKDIFQYMNFIKFCDYMAKSNNEWFYIIKETIGIAVIAATILHIYLVPLLICDALGLEMTTWWLKFTDPVLGGLGALAPSVENISRSLIELGHPERILIVRHAHGVVFACLIAFALRTLVDFHRVARIPVNIARHAVASGLDFPRTLTPKIRLFAGLLLLIASVTYTTYLGLKNLMFKDYFDFRNAWTNYWTEKFSMWHGAPVHVDNLLLLNIAWIGPFILYGVILLCVLFCIWAAVFVFESRRLREAK